MSIQIFSFLLFTDCQRFSIPNRNKVLIALITISILINDTHYCSADQKKFLSLTWDNNQQHIIRNGKPINEPSASIKPGGAGNSDFYFVKSSYDSNNDISYSGAGVENPQIHAHVYSFTNPFFAIDYTSKNTTGHKRTYNFAPSEIGHPLVRKFTFRDKINLNGSLILGLNEDTGNIENTAANKLGSQNLKGLSASFDILVTKETTKENGRIKSKKLLKGSVTLSGKKNGSYKVKTKGSIKKKHIGEITLDQGLVTVKLLDKTLLYSTRARVNQEFSINTIITSSATNLGYGTGAEAIFGPGDPTIPYYTATGDVPEPTCILLLSTGTLFFLRRRKG